MRRGTEGERREEGSSYRKKEISQDRKTLRWKSRTNWRGVGGSERC